MMPTSWWRANTSGPQAGTPARLSNMATRLSRLLNAA